MWGNLVLNSFNSINSVSFMSSNSGILLHIIQWQYWWWFWFSIFFIFYYNITIKVILYRSFKFYPKLSTSIRPRGRWGDLVVALIPIYWCSNILINSNSLLKVIEWQDYSSLITVRVRGKQWYWVYKLSSSSVTGFDRLDIILGNGSVFNLSNMVGDGQCDNLFDFWLRWNSIFYKSGLNYGGVSLCTDLLGANIVEYDNSNGLDTTNFIHLIEYILYSQIISGSKLCVSNTIHPNTIYIDYYVPTTGVKYGDVYFNDSVLLLYMDSYLDLFIRTLRTDTNTIDSVFLLEQGFLSKKLIETDVYFTNYIQTDPLINLFNYVIGLDLLGCVYLEKLMGLDCTFTSINSRWDSNGVVLSEIALLDSIVGYKKLNGLVYYLPDSPELVFYLNNVYVGLLYMDPFGEFKCDVDGCMLRTSREFVNLVLFVSDESNTSILESVLNKPDLCNDFFEKIGSSYEHPVTYTFTTENGLVNLDYFSNNPGLFFNKNNHLNLGYSNWYLYYNNRLSYVFSLGDSDCIFSGVLGFLDRSSNSISVIKGFLGNRIFELSFIESTESIKIPRYFLTMRQKPLKNWFSYLTNNFSTDSNGGIYNYLKKSINSHVQFYSDVFTLSNSNRLLNTTTLLVLPTGRTISIISNSFDVVHSWFIPGLGLKIDCVPGRSTHHILKIDVPGFYYGQCAEICGRFHHHMPIKLCALVFEHFLLWWQHYFVYLNLADNWADSLLIDRGRYSKLL